MDKVSSGLHAGHSPSHVENLINYGKNESFQHSCKKLLGVQIVLHIFALSWYSGLYMK